jgi:membrane fusion protein, multidrug efflux system
MAFGALAQSPGELDLECLLEPHITVKIGTPVPGALSQVLVDRGDVVRKGQVVATLDSRAQAAAVELSRARVEYTKRRMVPNEELYRDELLSLQQKDEVETDAELARLELLERETQVEIRRIVSPINGVVVERLKGPGEYVQETEILELAQIDPLNVEVVVPVRYFGRIRSGMKAQVRPEALLEGSYEARVKIVDKVIDAASGTFGVRLEIPNRDLSIPAGLRCNARFERRVFFRRAGIGPNACRRRLRSATPRPLQRRLLLHL